MTWTALPILAAAAAVACAVAVPPVRRLALRVGAVDEPGERRIHRQTTARFGGLAVLAAALLVVGIAAAAGFLASGMGPRLLPFLGGVLLVAAMGAADDMRPLSPLVKLGVEVVAALIVVVIGGCRISGISSLGGVLGLGDVAAPFTVVWIVLITNSLNLVDGIDGLAAGTAAIAFGAVTIIALGFGMPTVAMLSAILGGACVGFLVHNFHPATIFLGDSGSLSIGFALGVLSTYARAKGTTGAITLATLLIVAFPLGDAVLAVQRRYFRGLSPKSMRSHLQGFGRIFEPDRNHLHHRLLRAGLGQRSATYALYAIQLVACACAVYLLVRA